MRLRGWNHGLGIILVLAACESAPHPVRSGPFDWNLGSWKGVRRDVADGSESPMILRVEPLLGGTGQFRALEIGRGKNVYRGTAVQSFDPDTGRWMWQYTNSPRRPFARYAGSVEGDRSVWRSIREGRTRESRLVSERLEDGRWRRTMSISSDGGSSWTGLWIDELEKDPTSGRSGR